VTAKRFEHSVTERWGEPPHAEADWTPEHLVLAGLARCMLTALDFHAERAGIAVSGSASAKGVVTKREEDGRYAFTDIDCTLDVQLDPVPDADRVRELVDLAERDCFIGASLIAKPRYEWRVNGGLVG
jgi:organic hydroperoxide reductase OsmC/OhrA